MDAIPDTKYKKFPLYASIKFHDVYLVQVFEILHSL